MKKLAASLLFSLAVLAPVHAAEDVAAKREATMKSVGQSFKALAAIAKGASFDAALVSQNSQTIASNFETFGSLFDAGTEQASKQASPLIWTERSEFDQIRTDAIAAARALASTDEAGFKQAFGQLGASCKSCHTKFRLQE
jgi:cytochrome c556